MYQVCPKRRRTKTISPTPPGTTWAHITANNTPTPSSTDEGHMDKAHNHKQPEQALVTHVENDAREPRPLAPPSSSVTCNTNTPEHHATPILKPNIPAHTLWADENPYTEKPMQAELETVDNITTVKKGRPPLTHSVNGSDAGQDTVK